MVYRLAVAWCVLVLALVGSSAGEPASSAPGSPPSSGPTADEVLDRLLPPQEASDRPTTQPAVDVRASQRPATQPVTGMLREGTYLVDRVARLIPSADRREWVFHLEADGRGLQDPPLVALPNRKLMEAEAVLGDSGERKARVSGTVTEYRGRNYLLLEKAVPVPPPGRF